MYKIKQMLIYRHLKLIQKREFDTYFHIKYKSSIKTKNPFSAVKFFFFPQLYLPINN